jgi:HPt (histidine-containing phosphotransfer) domain-containing protein
MVMEIPGIDVKKGLDLYDNDLDIYLVVMQSYVSNMPATLEKLRNVSAETLRDYYITIHGVKGISANIGAKSIEETAKQLEKMAKAGDLPGVLAKNEAFLKSADVLLGDLQKWLKQYKTKV